MKVKVIIGVLVLLLVGGVYWGLDAAKQAKSDVNNKAAVSSTNETLSKEKTETPAIIDDQGGLQVSAEWLKQEGATAQQSFSISFNNHAVNVDNFDFKSNVTVLLDNKEIPIQIEVLDRNSSGHHLSAKLKIESPEFTKANVGSVLTLSIKNVYNTPTRNFTWKF